MKLLLGLILLMFWYQSLMAAEPTCLPKDPKDKTEFEKLFNNVSNTLSSTKPVNGYFLTSYNLKIEESCKERIPIKTLENFYRNTMSEGTLCLKNLSSIGNESLKNIACFEQLFADKSNPPKLLCGGWPFGKDIWAVGSFPGSSKRHPYLWLGPEISKLINTNPGELKATIFHEMLHNCGYIHSEGIEIPYTCEECCFNNSLADSKKKSACNICAGKYQDPNDTEYVKELLSWSADYPGWGRDMRMTVLEVAINNKNKQNLEILLAETKLSENQKEELLSLLLFNDNEKINTFLKTLNPLLLEDRVVKIISKRFTK